MLNLETRKAIRRYRYFVNEILIPAGINTCKDNVTLYDMANLCIHLNQALDYIRKILNSYKGKIPKDFFDIRFSMLDIEKPFKMINVVANTIKHGQLNKSNIFKTDDKGLISCVSYNEIHSCWLFQTENTQVDFVKVILIPIFDEIVAYTLNPFYTIEELFYLPKGLSLIGGYQLDSKPAEDWDTIQKIIDSLYVYCRQCGESVDDCLCNKYWILDKKLKSIPSKEEILFSQEDFFKVNSERGWK